MQHLPASICCSIAGSKGIPFAKEGPKTPPGERADLSTIASNAPSGPVKSNCLPWAIKVIPCRRRIRAVAPDQKIDFIIKTAKWQGEPVKISAPQPVPDPHSLGPYKMYPRIQLKLFPGQVSSP